MSAHVPLVLDVPKLIPPSAVAPSKASPLNINKLTSGKTQPYDPELIVQPFASVAVVAPAIGTPADPEIIL